MDIFGLNFNEDDFHLREKVDNIKFEQQKNIYKGHIDSPGWFLGKDPRLESARKPTSKRHQVYLKYAIDYHYAKGEYDLAFDKSKNAFYLMNGGAMSREFFDMAVRSARKFDPVVSLKLVQEFREGPKNHNYDDGLWDTFRMVYIHAERYQDAIGIAMESLKNGYRKRFEIWKDLAESIYQFVYSHKNIPWKEKMKRTEYLHLAHLSVQKALTILPRSPPHGLDYTTRKYQRAKSSIEEIKNKVVDAINSADDRDIESFHVRLASLDAIISEQDKSVLTLSDANLIYNEWRQSQIGSKGPQDDMENFQSVRDL